MAAPARERIELRPQPGPQEQFLASSADITIAGGAAGVGKTWGLLAECLRHSDNGGFGAVIFRRESPQITNQGGLWDESAEMYPHFSALPNQVSLSWRFPSGAKVRFSHMQYPKDRFNWDGSQIPLIGFDQLEHFEEIQFWYMLARNRSLCGVRPYIRATCNPIPDDDPIGGWLHRLISWWLDDETGYPITTRSGVVRWFVRINEELHWADSPQALRRRFPATPAAKLKPKSLTFIPGKLSDNRSPRTSSIRSGAAHVRVGNRVEIPIEADVGRFAGADGAHRVRLKGVCRQREQPGLFLRQHVGDRPVALLGMAPLMGDVVPPAAKLGVEVVEVTKRPGRKERVAEVLDLALDFPLLIAPSRRTGPGREVIVPRELEQARVKLNRRAPPVEHGTAEIVVDQGPGTAAQGREGRDVPTQEALERLVQREEREEGARVAEDHHEP